MLMSSPVHVVPTLTPTAHVEHEATSKNGSATVDLKTPTDAAEKLRFPRLEDKWLQGGWDHFAKAGGSFQPVNTSGALGRRGSANVPFPDWAQESDIPAVLEDTLCLPECDYVEMQLDSIERAHDALHVSTQPVTSPKTRSTRAGSTSSQPGVSEARSRSSSWLHKVKSKFTKKQSTVHPATVPDDIPVSPIHVEDKPQVKQKPSKGIGRLFSWGKKKGKK